MQRSLMDHPITPPPELVFQWHREACKDPYNGGTFFESKTLKHIATQAAQWGADQELEACCDWVSQWRCMVGGNRPEVGLRAARRPKPPSLKEQALALVSYTNAGDHLDGAALDTIRRALEQLDD
jgi:hypothetical protein